MNSYVSDLVSVCSLGDKYYLLQEDKHYNIHLHIGNKQISHSVGEEGAMFIPVAVPGQRNFDFV